MKRISFIMSAILIAAFALAACSPATALNNSLTGKANGIAQATSPTPVATLPAGSGTTSNPVTGSYPETAVIAAMQGTLEQIYTTMSPSVVNIQVTSGVSSGSQQTPSSPFGFGGNNGNQGSQVSQALGSGFIYDNQGHIVTNNHVVDGAENIQVTFSDGFTVPAKVVGKDLNSDLAVVKVDVTGERLHPVTMADSNTVKVGQIAIAIGNPYGLSGSMTMGIVSAIGRSLPVDSGSTSGSYTIPEIIQTDAPINPGNSGGPLMNDQGQVIGVNSAIESGTGSNTGVGFAIPAEIVQKVVPELIQKGSIQYSWIGISGTTLTYDINQAMGLKSDQRGLVVVDVTSGGPAEKAGIKGSTGQKTVNGQNVPIGGDVITAVDGKPFNTFEDLVAYLMLNTQPGQKVTLTVLRDGKEQQVEATLATRPATPAATTSASPVPQFAQPSASVYLGVSGLDLTPEVNSAMGLNDTQQGVLVVQVQPGSPAEKAGINAGNKSATINGQQVQIGGDVITAIDNQALTSVQELRAAIQQATPGQSVTLSLLRNGQQVDVKVTLAQRPTQ